FSATLLRVRDGQPDAGTYSLLFRSTEWKNIERGGDYQRDGYDGAGGNIKDIGFALGQLRDMEWYMSRLREGILTHGTEQDGIAIKNALAAGAKIDVLGYSLGAHLATVFTELHARQDLVRSTTVFNARGRGAN